MQLREKNKSPIKGVLTAVGILLAVVMMAVMVRFFVVKPIRAAEHYLQVWKKPVTVTATVTDYDSYDDDGDTDYRSYISYEYNGVRYQNLKYEAEDTKNALTPVGTEVNIKISPEDPSVRIDQLKNDGRGLYIGLGLCALILAFLYNSLQKRRLTKELIGTPDSDTVQRDLKLKILGSGGCAFWPLSAVFYGVAAWRYSMLLGDGAWVVCGICCLLGVRKWVVTIRNCRRVESGEFELRHDVLVDKQEYHDTEGSSYTLYYQNDNRKWKLNTSRKNYERAEIGDTIVAVYLAGNKKPTIHYNHEGNAQ